MALNSTHPLYDQAVPDWEMMRDTYSGERAVKLQRTKYLPATPGQELDGMVSSNDKGYKDYSAYLGRAVFHDFVSDAVESLIGLMHQKEATIELPEQLEPLRNMATINGEGLQALLRRINEQQLAIGRLGLLVDLPLNPDPANPLPYVALYNAEAVRNWDDSSDSLGRDKLQLVVLDETGQERGQDFSWETVTRYRVLKLADEGEVISDSVIPFSGTYIAGQFSGDESNTYSSGMMLQPNVRGHVLDEIPFIFINSKDILATPDNSPLLGLARLALAIYRMEADYRHTLFLQGQDTLVVIGDLVTNQVEPNGASETRVGAGSLLNVSIGGDVKYVGVQSQGLPELRMALENDKKQASSKAGQLIDTTNRQKESGEALHTRLAAQTASLNQIAVTGAAALESALKRAAVWIGADPSKVKVTPNLEFADKVLDGKELLDTMSARSMGAPLSLQSIHKVMQDRGLTTLSLEDELALIAEEDANMLTGKRSGMLTGNEE